MITINNTGSKTKITIDVERFDVNAMKEIKEEIQKTIADKHQIVLDMSKVKFLDSSGLSVLISTLKTLNNIEDASLTLCALGEQPTELMEITQLNNVFDIAVECSVS